MDSRQRKVVVRLKGGIGNQLFQYGFALLLAHGDPRNVLCLLDYFRSDPRHGGFALGLLLGPEVMTVDALPTGHNWAYFNADALADSDLSFLRGSDFDIFIDGYFQNAWNFVPVIERLRAMFASQFDRSGCEARLRGMLNKGPGDAVVAIHLRRGDFLNPEVRKVHGIPATESILGCLGRIQADYAAVVFSDSKVEIDLPCPALHLGEDGPRSLSGDIDQMRLMSSCDWIIASNSTFSYWAAMLSMRMRQAFVPDPWMRSGGVRTHSLLTGRIEPYATQLL